MARTRLISLRIELPLLAMVDRQAKAEKKKRPNMTRSKMINLMLRALLEAQPKRGDALTNQGSVAVKAEAVSPIASAGRSKVAPSKSKLTIHSGGRGGGKTAATNKAMAERGAKQSKGEQDLMPKCPRCGFALKQWGPTLKRCTVCEQNFSDVQLMAGA